MEGSLLLNMRPEDVEFGVELEDDLYWELDVEGEDDDHNTLSRWYITLCIICVWLLPLILILVMMIIIIPAITMTIQLFFFIATSSISTLIGKALLA